MRTSLCRARQGSWVNPMRILHVTHRIWPVVGGSERYVMELSRRQAAEGHEVTVVATMADALPALWSPRGQLVSCPPTGRHNSVHIVRLPVRYLPLADLAFPLVRRMTWWLSKISPQLAMKVGSLAPWIPDLPNLLQDLDADLLFAWNLTLEGLTRATADYAARWNRPWIAVPLLHLAHPRFYTMPHQLALLRKATCVIVQTPTERKFLASRGLAPWRLRIVSPGVDPLSTADADGERFRQKLGIEQSPLVVMLGRLVPDKGALHLVRALEALWAVGFPVELALVGTMSSEVRRAVDRLGMPGRDHCHCLGPVDESEKWDAMAASDLVALPSRTESFGIVFLEAWLLGKPVIGARSGAIADVVSDSEDGVLVDFGDIPQLSAAIRRLIEYRDVAHRMGNQGRKKVFASYTWEIQYSHLRDVVDQVVMEYT